MPCIQVYTNVSVSADKSAAIKSELGQIISNLPGKSEEWLLVILNDNCSMSFHGADNRPFALAEVKVWGDKIDAEGSRKMTAAVTELLKRELNVEPNDMYIRYIATMDWGWNGQNL